MKGLYTELCFTTTSHDVFPGCHCRIDVPESLAFTFTQLRGRVFQVLRVRPAKGVENVYAAPEATEDDFVLPVEFVAGLWP